MLTKTKNSSYSKLSPLPWNCTEWTDGFWADAFETCANKTVPHLQKMFESKDVSHVLENFKICAGDAKGEHSGTVFGDGDFYKWMEAAMYSAYKTNNKKLKKQLDEYIDLISRAQLDDGYLSTKQIIDEITKGKKTRLADINNFEIYNLGHLCTSACLYKRLSGKDNFLKVAIKAAEYMEKIYKEAAKTGEVKTAVCPSHYMGLIELYRTTGEKKYLDLASLAIELRDSVENGMDDNQDRIPLKEHKKIVGHAVRANYLYAGVADLCLETKDEEYEEVLKNVWRNLVDQKIYITGGCGALYNGTSPYGNFFIDQKVHQAYGYEYQLPNVTAYNETCASVGSVLWAYRMFLKEPKAEYFNIIERTMLNVNLAAVSLDGTKYFYENMLRRAKELPYELIWPLERTEYILSYCCPPNLARTISQSSEYLYTVSDDTVWTGMYGASKAKISLDSGSSFTLIQSTKYPYDGEIDVTIEDEKDFKPFYINVRIPEWVKSGYIKIAGSKKLLSEDNASSYIKFKVENPDSQICINFDMPARYTMGHPLIEEVTNQAAIERGPLVYCIESPDINLSSLDDLLIDPSSKFEAIDYKIKGRNLKALNGHLLSIKRNNYSENSLYQTVDYSGLEKVEARFIPYFAWDNRGYGEMKIWLPLAYK